MGTGVLSEPEIFGDEPASSAFTLGDGVGFVVVEPMAGREGPCEDVAALLPLGGSCGLLIIADGAGGHVGGAQAARDAVAALIETVCAHVGDDGGDAELVRDGIMRGFDAANEAVSAPGAGSATTLVVVEARPGTARTYHAGDSVALAVGQRGKMRLQTMAHSPVGYAVEAGLLDELEAMYHDSRHEVSNLLGYPEMRIEVGPVVALKARDTLIVGSDGLFDNLHVSEIVNIVRTGALDKAASELRELTRKRMAGEDEAEPGKPDDLSFILFRAA